MFNKSTTHSLEIQLAEILVKEDPIKIYFPDLNNKDEYVGEAREIVSQLVPYMERDDILQIVYNVFKRRFGRNAGTEESYFSIVDKIDKLLR